MGSVLAMRCVRRHNRLAAFALGMGLILSACTNDPSGTAPYQIIGANARDILGLDPPTAEDPAMAGLSREALAGVETPLILALIPEINAAAVVYVAARNRGVWTYESADGNTVLMDGPVLFRTAGIGPDLLSADTRQLRAMLEAGETGSLTRTLRHLDGLDQAVPTVFACDLRNLGRDDVVVLERQYTTRHMQEVCTSELGFVVENDYWIGANGTPWQTKQWVSQRVGYVVTQQLVP